MVGKKSEEEKAGYFGEHLVLKAQALGLNTCWVAMTFKKSACKRNCRITSLQGLGKGMVPMIGGILELVGRLAVIMLFAKDYGYPAVCLASPAAWIFAGIPNMAAYLLWKRRTKKLL